MADAEIKIIERKIESKADALAYGAAEAFGKGAVYALIFAGLMAWINREDVSADPAADQQPQSHQQS